MANEWRGCVAERSRGLDGEALGRAQANPFFDTRDYDIKFTDGSVDKYTANVIAENIFAPVDDEETLISARERDHGSQEGQYSYSHI